MQHEHCMELYHLGRSLAESKFEEKEEAERRALTLTPAQTEAWTAYHSWVKSQLLFAQGAIALKEERQLFPLLAMEKYAGDQIAAGNEVGFFTRAQGRLSKHIANYRKAFVGSEDGVEIRRSNEKKVQELFLTLDRQPIGDSIVQMSCILLGRMGRWDGAPAAAEFVEYQERAATRKPLLPMSVSL